MMIHHLVANCLFFCAIFGNIIHFGAVLAYLHDIADVPANLGKVLSSTTFEKAALVDGVLLMLSWAHTRIILLPICIYRLFFMSYPEQFIQF